MEFEEQPTGNAQVWSQVRTQNTGRGGKESRPERWYSSKPCRLCGGWLNRTGGNTMGYESKLFVVKKHSNISQNIDGKEMIWGQVIATIDFGKYYQMSDRMRYEKETNCYIYAVGCDERIVDDCYGEPLKEMSLDRTIDILKEAREEYPYYMVDIALGLLKEFRFSPLDDVVVLHYGY